GHDSGALRRAHLLESLCGEAQTLTHHLLLARCNFWRQFERADPDLPHLVELVHDFEEAAAADLRVALAQPAQFALLPVCLSGQESVHARALLVRYLFADEPHGDFLGGVHGLRGQSLDDTDAGDDDASATHLL